MLFDRSRPPLPKSPESYEIRFYAALTNYLLNRHEQAVLILAP